MLNPIVNLVKLKNSFSKYKHIALMPIQYFQKVDILKVKFKFFEI